MGRSMIITRSLHRPSNAQRLATWILRGGMGYSDRIDRLPHPLCHRWDKPQRPTTKRLAYTVKIERTGTG